MKASGLLHHCCTAVHAWSVLLTFGCAKLVTPAAWQNTCCQAEHCCLPLSS